MRVCAHINYGPWNNGHERFATVADAVEHFRNLDADPYGPVSEVVPGEHPVMDIYPELTDGVACDCTATMNFHDYPAARYVFGPLGGVVRQRP